MNRSADLLLMVSALVFGLPHGIDWDHIAAIPDITGSKTQARNGLWLGTVYALGHATVLTILGLLGIWAGAALPAWVDGIMERVVEITLVMLGVYVTYSVLQDRGNFQLRSRWMLLFDWAELGYHKLMTAFTGTQAETPARRRSYGSTSAFLIGLIHGVRAETPTQILLFVAAAGAQGSTLGLLLLLIFIAGLFISNSIITVMSTFGFIRAQRSTPALMWLGGLTAAFSLTVGTVFLLGRAGSLPAILGG